MIGSPVNISRAGSSVPDLFFLAGSALETSLLASALDSAGVPLGTDDYMMVAVLAALNNAATSGSFFGSGARLAEA
jgi:hypothetical protein